MTILNSAIATEDSGTVGPGIGQVRGIETESEVDPKWEECQDALLDVLCTDSDYWEEQMVTPPNRRAIGAAIQWLRFLRASYPVAPPTLITAEPAGGIVVELTSRRSTGQEMVVEFTFYNNGHAENTVFIDRRVKQMVDIPFAPPQLP
jgi:hypothetical protein